MGRVDHSFEKNNFGILVYFEIALLVKIITGVELPNADKLNVNYGTRKALVKSVLVFNDLWGYVSRMSSVLLSSICLLLYLSSSINQVN